MLGKSKVLKKEKKKQKQKKKKGKRIRRKVGGDDEGFSKRN